MVAHVCEVAQLRAAVDDDDAIHRVCQAGVARVRRVAAPVMQSLVADDERLDGRGRQRCITVDLFDAVQANLWRTPTRRLREKSAPGSDTPSAKAGSLRERGAIQARSGPPKRKASAKRDATRQVATQGRSSPPKRKASVKGGAARKVVTQARSGPPKRKVSVKLKARRKTKQGNLDGRFVQAPRGHGKDRISCPQCGREVRRDNLARHVGSTQCARSR